MNAASTLSPAARRDMTYHLHPSTNLRAVQNDGPLVITRGEGVYVFDEQGNRYLEGMAGLWCTALGFSESRLADAASRQMRELPFYHAFAGKVPAIATELAEALMAIAPANLARVIFANSGSEANDTALKLIRYYWNLHGKPEKKIHLSREYSYHGVTMAAASLSGLTAMHTQWDLPLPGYEKVPTAYWYGFGGNQDPNEYGVAVARKLEQKILELGPERVASFSAEPIHGAGGLMFPPDSYWPEIQRICREYDVLLHLDEVITGFGRTGKWFGADLYGIDPDIMSMA